MIVFSPDGDTISVVNAGHMPPLLCRQSSEPIGIGEDARGIPLLVVDSFPYEVAEERLEPGDRILIYTDGLHESMNADDQIYGIDRLCQQLKSQADGGELIEQILEDIRRFANGVPPMDDMCVVCCTRL
jgi:serine phosphatase RsbU (regulator of sigma subunit)